MEKPDPKNYPFNYVVGFTDSDYDPGSSMGGCEELEGAESYQAALRMIQQKFPLAVAADNWDDLHQKAVWENRETMAIGFEGAYDLNNPTYPCAFIERRRESFDAAMTEYEGEQAVLYFAEEKKRTEREANEQPTAETCDVCGVHVRGDAVECEDCDMIFCSGSCERQHGCPGPEED